MTRFLNSANAAAVLLACLMSLAGRAAIIRPPTSSHPSQTTRAGPLEHTISLEAATLQIVQQPRPRGLLDAGLLALLISIARKLKS